MTLTPEQLIDLKTMWDYMKVDLLPGNRKADIIIALGTYNLTPAERAAELYHQGYAPYIIVSGYANEIFPQSEARAMAVYLRQQNIPEEAIFIEDQASNTGHNITLSFSLATRFNLPLNKIILTQKPYMTRRSLATAQAQWPDKNSEIYVSCLDLTFEEYLSQKSSPRTIELMLHDYDAIKSYPAKGFSTVQPISPIAEAARERLRTLQS